MPAALDSQQRDLIYKGRNHPTLLNEPGVTVTMDDGEDVKLEPTNYYNKPHTKKSLIRFVRFLDGNENDEAWDNLLPFLKGLVLAQKRLPHTFPGKITRKACEAGRANLIIQIAGVPKETGISLRQEDVAKELMIGAHNSAAGAGFQGPQMYRLLQRVENVGRMLLKQLGTKEKLRIGECDARTDPVVMSVMLELAAIRALHKHEGEDQTGKVVDYANKLLHMQGWKPAADLSTASPHARNHALVGMIPVWKAMEWALKVESVRKSDLEKQLKTEVQNLAEVVKKTAHGLAAISEGQPRRGLQMYDQVSMEEPLNPTAPVADAADAGKEEVQQ